MKQKFNSKSILFISLIFLLCISENVFAQGPIGMGGRGGMGHPEGMKGGFSRQSAPQNMKEINFLEAAGIRHYNIDDVFKKLKIKKNSIKENIKKTFICYEDSLIRITLTYPKEYDFLNNAKENMEMIRKSGDMQNMKKFMTQIRNCTEIISPIVNHYNENLNNDLKKDLSEKDMKKWLKYVNKLYENMPKMGMNERPIINRNQFNMTK